MSRTLFVVNQLQLRGPHILNLRKVSGIRHGVLYIPELQNECPPDTSIFTFFTPLDIREINVQIQNRRIPTHHTPPPPHIPTQKCPADTNFEAPFHVTTDKKQNTSEGIFYIADAGEKKEKQHEQLECSTLSMPPRHPAYTPMCVQRVLVKQKGIKEQGQKKS